jgi:hypothetical protein
MIIRGFLYFLALILSVELIFYFTTPVYDFPPPAPFGGDKIFNPYKGMDSTKWLKANFHFHTRAWSGLTSGRKNSDSAFWSTYRNMGYDVPCISNYQSISKFNKDSAFYIPVYEHGFGIRKKHQLCIGAEEVLWLDYSIYQNLNHKQHIIDRLHDQCKIVALAHPDWEKGYSLNDMMFLSNYDLIEVLDQNWRSVEQWDAALSSGHPVYIVGDDDAHDIYDTYQIGRCCTFINAASNHSADVLRSLKEGNAFGADVYMYDKSSFDEKAAQAKLIPRLDRVEVIGDTLHVAVSSVAMSIEFIGQGGVIKKTVNNTKTASYRILPEDTYIRTVIIFATNFQAPGTKFYLNPVFRYNGEKPSNALRAEFNFPRTWILRIFSIPALLFFLVFIGYMTRKKKAQN